MNENGVIEALQKGNPWWKGEFKLEFKPREVYENIKKFLHTRQIIALTGLRRVGKTTIMLQAAKESLPKYGATNIIYFSFDEFKGVRADEVIKTYAQLMNKDITKISCLLLLDEIQKIENWAEQLKRIYDTWPNLKIIISGSESLFIRKDSKESLAGRMYEFNVKPLNFKEYLLFRDKKFDNLALYKDDILREFRSFLICNGFPEIVNEEKEIAEKYIQNNVIEKIIYRDIPQIIPIREPAILEQILKIILMDPGEMINMDELAKELQASRQTISIYLEYLEKSFLIKKLYNFSKNARKTQRRFKKYYPTIILPELNEKIELSGKIFETAIILQLDIEYFWRDQYKNEVDAIKIIGKEILPIEIKTTKTDDKALQLFMKKFKVNKGLILTYEKKENRNIDGKEILIRPFYEYLLGQI